MAVPRPVLLALLGVALCAAAFLATRGARDPGGAVTSVPAPAHAPAPAPKAKTPADPQPQKPVEPRRHAAQPNQDPAPAKRDPAPAKPSVKPAAPAAPTTSGPLDGIRTAAQAAANPGAAKLAKPAAPRPAPSVASRVKAAFAADDVVVFFFTRSGAADDVGTRQSVEALKGVDRVTVVKAGLSDLDDFGPVLAGAGVSQVPSVVIARKDRPARLLEGYVDRGSLRQTVADALR